MIFAVCIAPGFPLGSIGNAPVAGVSE